MPISKEQFIPMNVKYLRVNDVAQYLAVSKSQVWKLTAEGTLKSYKISERVTVWKLEELEAYMAQKIGAYYETI